VIFILKRTIMDNLKIGSTLDNFLGKKSVKNLNEDGTEQEVCDMNTGECYVIRSKDGIVERINKRYITEDGRQLLSD
tara:strand:+ start:735 stop:965 length:231 start_codon:yes stop_codon:yes gene_type:complete